MKDNKDLNNDMEKLNDKDTDQVSGGVLWQDDDYDDGFEKTCYFHFHEENECDKSSDGYHFLERISTMEYQCTRCKKIYGGGA